MTKENIIDKIGSILMELRNEYVTINHLQNKVSEIDLELFAANSIYLNQHIDILKKLIAHDEAVSIDKVEIPSNTPPVEELSLNKQSVIEPESFVATQGPEDSSEPHLDTNIASSPSSAITIDTGAKESIRAEINSRFQAEKSSINDRLSQLNTGKQHVNESVRKQVKDIRAGIGLNEKFAFIKTLFNNDQKIYEQSLDHINTLSTIHEARSYVKNELTSAYQWNKKQEIAEHFLTVLNKRFSG